MQDISMKSNPQYKQLARSSKAPSAHVQKIYQTADHGYYTLVQLLNQMHYAKIDQREMIEKLPKLAVGQSADFVSHLVWDGTTWIPNNNPIRRVK